MKRKNAVAFISLFVACIWAINVFKVNTDVEKAPVAVYPMGQWVEYGDNFYDKETEGRSGYSVKVVDADVVRFDEYLNQHNISVFKDEELFKPEYIYDVTVVVKNDNNSDSGISMIDTTLNSVNDIMQVDFDVFDALYPQLYGSVSFSVKPGTEMEFHFPFVIANESFQKVCDYKYLTGETFYLNLSQYPVKQRIEIKVQD